MGRGRIGDRRPSSQQPIPRWILLWLPRGQRWNRCTTHRGSPACSAHPVRCARLGARLPTRSDAPLPRGDTRDARGARLDLEAARRASKPHRHRRRAHRTGLSPHTSTSPNISASHLKPPHPHTASALTERASCLVSQSHRSRNHASYERCL